MITEDYVSFEVAKLLKEKGFNENITTYRDDFIQHGNIVISLQECLSKDKIKNPTIQMVMKWLREIHNLSIEVYRTACGYVGCIVAIPSGTDKKFFEDDGDDENSGQYTTWEKACEAAIKYCLTNLI